MKNDCGNKLINSGTKISPKQTKQTKLESIKRYVISQYRYETGIDVLTDIVGILNDAEADNSHT